jgi:prepilin-type processing-associated H-X9-DG protein
MYHSKSGPESFGYAAPDLSFPSFRGVRLTMIKDPASYPLIFDTSGYNDYRYKSGTNTWMSEAIYSPGTPAQARQGIWMAHGRTANGIFADFHVEACDEGALRSCAVPNRNVSTKHGISAWKDFTGKEIAVDW